MIPDGLIHDPVSAVIVRHGRAARLNSTANAALRDLIAAGGEADVRTLGHAPAAPRAHTTPRVRTELRALNTALRRLSIKVAITPADVARLVEIARRPSR